MPHFGHYSYLITIVIFAAGSVLIEWFLAPVTIRRHRRLIGVVAAILVITTSPAEWFALRWRVWTYSPDRTFDTRVAGAEIETYMFALFVTIAVASATVACAKYQDQGKPLSVKTWMDANIQTRRADQASGPNQQK